LVDELVAVYRVAFDREEGIAWLDMAGVIGYSGDCAGARSSELAEEAALELAGTSLAARAAPLSRRSSDKS
jgi:hypothetical protein